MQQRHGRPDAVGRGGQHGIPAYSPGGHSGVCNVEINGLAGNGLLQRPTGGSQPGRCVRLEILGHSDVLPVRRSGTDPAVLCHTGPGPDIRALLDQVVRNVAVRQLCDSQAVMAHRQDSRVDIGPGQLALQVQEVLAEGDGLGVGKRQICVVVQVVAVGLVPNQQIPAQGRSGKPGGQGIHGGKILGGTAGNVVVGVRHRTHAGLDLLLGRGLGIVLRHEPAEQVTHHVAAVGGRLVIRVLGEIVRKHERGHRGIVQGGHNALCRYLQAVGEVAHLGCDASPPHHIAALQQLQTGPHIGQLVPVRVIRRQRELHGARLAGGKVHRRRRGAQPVHLVGAARIVQDVIPVTQLIASKVLRSLLGVRATDGKPGNSLAAYRASVAHSDAS